MRSRSSTLILALVLGTVAPALAGEGSATVVNRSIGFAMTQRGFAAYTTADRSECPDGFFETGPREQFAARYPNDGTPRDYISTAMAYEGDVWFPKTEADPFPVPRNIGKISFGMNLDGKVGPNDYKSPDGEPGIDNQFFRATGCIRNYRGGGGGGPKVMQERAYNRILIELTDVDSLVNDDDVTLTTYRGLDPLFADAAGKEFLPHGTQRIDGRWGKEFVQRFHGKIKDGVLETEPADWTYPDASFWEEFTIQKVRALRWRLNVTSNQADGLMGGYLDVKTFYRNLNENTSTHHQSYGQFSAPSLYRALNCYADAYPDPATGANTAISAALRVRFQQVFIEHPPQASASLDNERPSRPAKAAGAR